MPFSCQLKVPPFEDQPIKGQLDLWRKESGTMLERGDAIAQITIASKTYLLCVDFPCALGSQRVEPGQSIATGGIIATCGADGEAIPYGREYCFIKLSE